MPPKPLAYNATLVRRDDHTKELTTFFIRYEQPLGDGEGFRPGQYVALGLNNLEQPELGSVRRSMSLASAPEERDAYGFYVRYVSKPESDNPLTHLLWKARPGDGIFMTRKPVGKFTLEDTTGDDGRLTIMVAAGTGLAPFLSMVRSRHLRDPAADLSRYVILHGASYPTDLGYRDELERYAAQHGLHYFPTVSRPKEAPDWTGDVGRVEDYFLPERLAELESRLGLPAGGIEPRRAAILICGLQGTCANTILRFLPRGFVPDNRRIRKALGIDEAIKPNIWWEQYDTTPVIDVDDAALMAELGGQLRAALAAAG
jgi:ferredoxin/flavodoxin---NADP+ reductase